MSYFFFGIRKLKFFKKQVFFVSLRSLAFSNYVLAMFRNSNVNFLEKFQHFLVFFSRIKTLPITPVVSN